MVWILVDSLGLREDGGGGGGLALVASGISMEESMLWWCQLLLFLRLVYSGRVDEMQSFASFPGGLFTGVCILY